MDDASRGVQIEWEFIDTERLPTVRAGGDGISDVLMDPTIPVDREVRVQPIQFHTHAVSEHTIDGLYVRPLL